MFKSLFKKTPLFLVTVDFDGEVFTTTATSGGLASMMADPYAEILNCERIR